MIDDLFVSLGLDKAEWLEDIERGESSLASYLEMSVLARGNVERLRKDLIIIKLAMYKIFGKRVEFKKYLHGVSDAGTRLLFKFRLGTHGLNE